MSRSSHQHHWKVCAVASALVALTHGPGLAQERKEAPGARSKLAVARAERASGVIVKVEPIATADSGRSKPGDSKASHADRGKGRLVRLTINTDAIWSDWARDQVPATAAQSPKKAAEKGAKSVATKGEPETENSLVVIALTPASKVETRFRTLTDESTKGARKPSEARREEPGRPRSKDAKSPHFAAEDLRPGLFVEVDFHRRDGAQQASTVTVIRPVSEQGVPTESAKP